MHFLNPHLGEVDVFTNLLSPETSMSHPGMQHVDVSAPISDMHTQLPPAHAQVVSVSLWLLAEKCSMHVLDIVPR